MTTTTETLHGLLRLEGEEVSVQWRLDRKIDHLGGLNLYTDEEIEKVCEVTIPISALASRPLVCHTSCASGRYG